ncbi:bifunctional metallophosphatase/5'-nucleotidase [Bhargavaea cecembensis]|uniref:Bifunctional metallophosphatase/5'-nucleotidase n=1 Tax=Bhargavaea cecembensis TaxID=394098 RepID=A0A163F5C6_9BACL|nr:bifunctional UDP-sugar hydrolase/5'-nucleotidase [Bhargavaea cecembensis]KZE37991.1 bifunctional metallophosphatase/5'-nucleotidase [Bhargavaea cecembensis]
MDKLTLTILETSDVHGYLFPGDGRERDQNMELGLFKAATVIREEKRKADGPVLVIDNGDFIQGSPLTSYMKRERGTAAPIMDALNMMEFDAGVPGNHEFNHGLFYMMESVRAAKFPVLAANILDETGEPVTGKAYEIFEKDGVRIAVLGLVTCYIPHWEHPDHCAGLTFRSAVASAKEYVPMLREIADVVVVSYHGGLECDLETGEPTEMLTGENEGYALLTEVQGIDALLTGHQHKRIATVKNGIPVIQPGYRGEAVGKVTLELEKQEGSWRITGCNARLEEVKGKEADLVLAEQFSGLKGEMEAWLDTPIGGIVGEMSITDALDARISGHAYVDFINRVQMHHSGCAISATSLFSREATGFPPSVTLRDIVINYLYPNTLAVCRVTGSDLKEALELSAAYFELDPAGEIGINPAYIQPKAQHYNYDMYAGIEYTIDLTRPPGDRITVLIHDGHLIKPDETLEIVLNQYRAVGGGGYHMFGPSKITREVRVPMTELIAGYFKEHPVVMATQNRNFEVIRSGFGSEEDEVPDLQLESRA